MVRSHTSVACTLTKASRSCKRGSTLFCVPTSTRHMLLSDPNTVCPPCRPTWHRHRLLLVPLHLFHRRLPIPRCRPLPRAPGLCLIQETQSAISLSSTSACSRSDSSLSGNIQANTAKGRSPHLYGLFALSPTTSAWGLDEVIQRKQPGTRLRKRA